MIWAQPTGRGWALAAALSLAVHGAVAGGLLWRPSLPWLDRPDTPEELQVTAITLPPLDSAEPEGLDPVDPPETSVPDIPEVQTLTADDPAVEHDFGDPGQSPLLMNEALPVAPGVDTTSAISAPTAPDATDPAPNLDPRLVTLIQRIRSRIDQTCLLAIPGLDGDGGVQVTMLTADDGPVPTLMATLTEGLDDEVAGQTALVDPRQCPALGFARRDERYPVFPLGISLQSRDIPGGDNLRGTISGAAGRYVSLLLIDDNGVTHDLRRYLVSSGGRMRFDLPVAREGAARDTFQLLLAIATPSRPAAMSNAGEGAQDFFDRLGQELGPDTLMGLTSLYIRPPKL